MLIVLESKIIGAVRLYKEFDDLKLRISPIFILEKYQGKGYSQKVFILMEKIYSWVKVFKLDTIKEEKKLCYLYEKIGYVETGIYKKIKDNMIITYYEKIME